MQLDPQPSTEPLGSPMAPAGVTSDSTRHQDMGTGTSEQTPAAVSGSSRGGGSEGQALGGILGFGAGLGGSGVGRVSPERQGSGFGAGSSSSSGSRARGGSGSGGSGGVVERGEGFTQWQVEAEGGCSPDQLQLPATAASDVDLDLYDIDDRASDGGSLLTLVSHPPTAEAVLATAHASAEITTAATVAAAAAITVSRTEAGGRWQQHLYGSSNSSSGKAADAAPSGKGSSLGQVSAPLAPTTGLGGNVPLAAGHFSSSSAGVDAAAAVAAGGCGLGVPPVHPLQSLHGFPLSVVAEETAADIQSQCSGTSSRGGPGSAISPRTSLKAPAAAGGGTGVTHMGSLGSPAVAAGGAPLPPGRVGASGAGSSSSPDKRTVAGAAAAAAAAGRQQQRPLTPPEHQQQQQQRPSVPQQQQQQQRQQQQHMYRAHLKPATAIKRADSSEDMLMGGAGGAAAAGQLRVLLAEDNAINMKVWDSERLRLVKGVCNDVKWQGEYKDLLLLVLLWISTC